MKLGIVQFMILPSSFLLLAFYLAADLAAAPMMLPAAVPAAPMIGAVLVSTVIVTVPALKTEPPPRADWLVWAANNLPAAGSVNTNSPPPVSASRQVSRKTRPSTRPAKDSTTCVDSALRCGQAQEQRKKAAGRSKKPIRFFIIELSL